MTQRSRHGTYLFQRPDSSMWWIRLRSGGQRIERSLATDDKRKAEIIALPMIAEHKQRLLDAKPRVEMAWHSQYEPRPQPYPGPDGELITATQCELHFYDAAGKLLRIAPNGGLAKVVTNVPPGDGAVLMIDWAKVEREQERPKLAVQNGDDDIFETYLAHRNITGLKEREARDVWALFKSLCNKPLKDCSRDDGRKLATHYLDQGNKSATVKKKIGWLTSAVNLAIREGRLKFNPFSSVVPANNDAQAKVPLDDSDMKTIKRNMEKLSEADALLFRILASTGMRLGEAWSIESEQRERNCRFVIIGSKTEQSRRRVPFPTALLPFLPAKIEGRLFQGDARGASKRLNAFLDQCGITDKAKTVHSLRHRAADRLCAAGAPVDIRHALLGHETRTVADSYGSGHPVALLRKWIDRINGI